MSEPYGATNLLPENDLADLREAVVLLEQDWRICWRRRSTRCC